MVRFVQAGNLLEADVDAIVNAVNTKGVMGKGIALQFKRAFPGNFERYRAACQAGDVRLGEMFVTETQRANNPCLIINFPTKTTGSRGRASRTSRPAFRTCAAYWTNKM
jgi:O-acetyl-ADP-ribose deacetylase (regulator of RNase III)